MVTIHFTNLIIGDVLGTLYTIINLILYIDLYWIIKNPFYPQSKRLNAYRATALITSLLVSTESFIFYSTADAVPTGRNIYRHVFYLGFSLLMAVFTVILLVLIAK